MGNQKHSGPQVALILPRRGANRRRSVTKCFDFALLALAMVRIAAAGPVNDNFADRLWISGTDTNISAENTLATTEPSEPTHPPPASGHSLWWAWTAPGDGWLQFSGIAPSVPAAIAVYQGETLTNLILAQQILERLSDVWHIVIRTNPHPQWVVRSGHSYQIVASAITNDTGLVTGEFNYGVSFVPGPPNDYFPGEWITNLPYSTLTGNWGASPEPGEPLLVWTGLGASLWWSWQASESGRLNLHAVNYYPTFGVFTGNAVDHLTLVAGGDGNVSTPVRAGQVYRIGADTWPGDGTFIGFSLDFSPSPVNDDFTARIPIRGAQGCVGGHNRGATPEADETIFGAAAGGTVWYSWLAPADGWVWLEASATNGRPVFIVYDGQERTNLSVVLGSSFPSIPNPLNHVPGAADGSFAARAGVEYQIAVDTWPVYGEQPNFTDFELCVDETTLRIISPTNGESLAGTVLPTFRVNAPLESVAGVLTSVDYQQGRFYSGNWGYSLGMSTNPPFTVTAHYTSPGLWSVTAYASNTLGQLRASPPVWFKVRPGNDDFTNSVVLTGFRWGWPEFPWDWWGRILGTTQFATAEAGEPAHAGRPAVATVWYSWTAPASGVAVYDYSWNAAGTEFPIYTGNELSRLQPVSLLTSYANQDPFSGYFFGVVTFLAESGTTYHFGASAASPDWDQYASALSLALELQRPELTSPTNELVLTEPADVPLAVTNLNRFPALKRLEYLADGRVIAAAARPPYDAVWRHARMGRYNITARALTRGDFVAESSAATLIIRPANDDFARRAPLHGARGTVTGCNTTASLEAAEPNPVGCVGAESVWYTWQTPTARRVVLTVHVQSAGFVPALAVYTGGSLSNLNLIASGRATEAQPNRADVSFDALRDVGYQIAVVSCGELAGCFKLDLSEQLVPNLTLTRLAEPTGKPVLVVSGTPGQTIIIESSTNLTHWTPICTNRHTQATFEFTDPTAGGSSQRFYRVVTDQ